MALKRTLVHNQPETSHQAPTPGIGLRRLIHQRAGIVTITVRETYTSTFCARRSCRAEVEEAVRNGRRTHALLGCQACGATWRRDVLGARNILEKGLPDAELSTPSVVWILDTYLPPADSRRGAQDLSHTIWQQQSQHMQHPQLAVDRL